MLIEILSELPMDITPWDPSDFRAFVNKGDVVEVELPTKESYPDMTTLEIKQWGIWFENGLTKGFFRKKPGRPKEKTN